MTDKKTEALKLALEALDRSMRTTLHNSLSIDCANAITAIREALAEQPAQQQEPVAWKDRTYGNLHHQNFGNSIPLYTSPPAQPWVGLTDEQIQAIAFEAVKDNWDWLKFARAIEAKLREKNA